MRWLTWAAQEMNIRGYKYLLPTEEELAQMAPEQAQMMLENMMGQLKGGQSPQNVAVEP